VIGSDGQAPLADVHARDAASPPVVTAEPAPAARGEEPAPEVVGDAQDILDLGA
jgi:hypothetical protein